MRASVERAVYVCCVIVSGCFLSSCAQRPLWKITTQDIPILTEDPMERIPLRAGFFMNEKFKEVLFGGSGAFQYLYNNQGVMKSNIDFDVRTAFEQAARRMFQEVVPITATETSEDWKTKNLDVVVFVSAPICTSEFGHLTYTTLSAEWSVMSPDSKMITSVRAVGEGQAQSGDGARGELIKAVDSHIKKVYDNIVMSAWWHDSLWKSN
jgi:hypothetical protein